MEPTLVGAAALLSQIAMGVGLAACAGLRAFLPLLVVGVAGRIDWLPLTSSFDWLASTPALIVFGVAVLVELAADKFPVVDNFLDAMQTFVKPVAGAIVAAGVLTELTPLQASVLGIVSGGAVAATVHLAKAKLRLASTLTTIGSANPVLSLVEDITSFFGALLSLLAPLFVACVVLLLLLGLAWFLKRRFTRVGHRV